MKEVAAIAILNDHHILMGKRRDNRLFTNPGGHLNPGEDPLKGAVREVKEETGLNLDPRKFVHVETRIVKKPSGEKLRVHGYKVHLQGKPPTSMRDDPDNEVFRWQWIKLDSGLAHIKDNLHVPIGDNVLLDNLISEGLPVKRHIGKFWNGARRVGKGAMDDIYDKATKEGPQQYLQHKEREKKASITIDPGMIGTVSGLTSGYHSGRSSAGTTANALSRKGYKTKNEETARNLAKVLGTAGAIGGLALGHKHKHKLVDLAKRKISSDPNMVGLYHGGIPFLSGTLGGIAAGTGTGALTSLRGRLFHKGQEKKASDLVHGGKADNMPDSKFPKDQIRKGMKVESEHTDNQALAKEISKDHLSENSHYYDYLDKMEKSMKKKAFWVGFLGG